MPTTVTKTVKSAGGDYSSLSAWEAAENGNLVAADEIRQAECYGFDDTTAVLFSGVATDATRYLRIYAHSSAAHGGIEKASSAGGGANYRLIVSTDNHAIQVDDYYARFDGLEIRQAGADAKGTFIVGAMAAGNDIRLDNCIISGDQATDWGPLNIYNVNTIATLTNCLIIYDGAGSSTYGLYSLGGTIGSCALRYCTFINRGTGAYGVQAEAKTTSTNVASFGWGTEDFYTGGSAQLGSHCASEDATADDDHTSSLVSLTMADQFVSLTASAEDYHLKSGSDLEAAGTPVGGVTLDIDGDTRDGSTPDIGFDEFESGAATLIVVSSTAGHTVAAPAQTQLHNLTLVAGTQGHTSTPVVLSKNVPAVSGTQGHEVAAPGQTQLHNLTVVNGTQGHNADLSVVSKVVEIVSGSQGHNVAAPAQTQLHNLTLVNGTQGHNGEAVSLTQAATEFDVFDGTQGHTVAAPTETQVHNLTVVSDTQGHEVAAPGETQVHNLSVTQATAGHTVAAPALVQLYTQAIANGTQGHNVAAPTQTQLHVLPAANGTQGHNGEAISFRPVINPASPEGGHMVAQPQLTQLHVLPVAGGTQGHEAQPTNLGLDCEPHDATQGHNCQAPQLTICDDFSPGGLMGACSLSYPDGLNMGSSISLPRAL